MVRRARKYRGPLDGADPVAVRSEVTLVPYDRAVPAWAWCHYCKTTRAATRDHVVPRAKGGPSRWWNLVPACEKCNTDKGDSPPTCACEFCGRARDWNDKRRKA